MSLIAEHRSARNAKAMIVLHEFKIRFRKNSRVIYGFVEGKDDHCFYRGFIENAIPNDWSIELWGAGGKDSVIEIYSKLDWRRFKKQQIVFFIDNDLSYFTGESIPKDINVYVTDNYSIENEIVNPNTCDRVLREICGFSELNQDISKNIESHFKEQLSCFQKSLIPIMANIIFWKKNNIKANLNDICMKHIFSVRRGFLERKSNPKGHGNIIEYIHRQCNVQQANDTQYTNIAREFEEKAYYKKFTRGKYLLWFLVEFCLSVYNDCSKLKFAEIKNKPKMTINMSHSNAIILIGTRAKMPLSLKCFFANTIDKYVATQNAV